MKSNTYAIVGALGLALLTGCAEMQGEAPVQRWLRRSRGQLRGTTST